MARLPSGTQVVSYRETKATDGHRYAPRGAVGVVVDARGQTDVTYLVRFPDGAEVWLGSEDVGVRKHIHSQGVEDGLSEAGGCDLWDHIIYRCVVGSRAYGLDTDESDIDRRGVYLPPADAHWSLSGVPEQLESPDHEECYWELHKFLTLALKANPNILECLHTPIVDYVAPLAQELLDMRSVFVSRMVYQTYNGYAMSQFKKMGDHLRRTGQMRWKHGMHLIRLLLSGIAALREGTIRVDMGEHRERLLAVRRGEVSPEKLEAWRIDLHCEFDAALAETALPEKPDYERANEFLIRARRSMVDGLTGST